MTSKLKTWKEIAPGTVIDNVPTSPEYKTGTWRSERPEWDPHKCKHCLICWLYCPDSAIRVDENGKMVGIDTDYCKGCGLCAEVCPPKVKAITMKPEEE